MKLEDQLRGKIRLRQLSRQTEETYVAWYKRFVRHFDRTHPAEMGVPEVEAFLTYLAAECDVAPPTQNQAL